MPVNKIFFGLMTRRERLGLSWRGWLAGFVFVLVMGVVWVLKVHSFLAQTKRVDTKVLVVEGWLHMYADQAALEEFRAGHYDKIYVTGGPVAGSGGYINDFNTYASIGAETLVRVGAPRELVKMVPSHVSGRDRTYSSALALREYFQTNGLNVKAFNVVTEDVHSRRTRMLFQEAFGSEATVGVVSLTDPDYNAARWWRYSEGVREVLGESIAWCYAEFLFHPERPKGK
jgi:uncharacterized SAM-binding protein YcdF (DUF218 family)